MGVIKLDNREETRYSKSSKGGANWIKLREVNPDFASSEGERSKSNDFRGRDMKVTKQKRA